MAQTEERTVCDLTLVMLTRIICGLYNRRSIPPHLHGLAKTYCLTLILLLLPSSIHLIFFLPDYVPTRLIFYYLINYTQYILAAIVSLWIGDEFIYKFFTRSKFTDDTLDSSVIFKSLQQQMIKVYRFAAILYVAHCVLAVALWYEKGLMRDFDSFHIAMATLVGEMLVSCSCTTKLLVMALFNSRMLVLRRRLERYGFRTIGRTPPQPYCQVYMEIWNGMDATNVPLKFLLFVDLIATCCKTVILSLLVIRRLEWQDGEIGSIALELIYNVVLVSERLFHSFGHVALLESAAAHCEAMAVFTATQLIKTPTRAERQHMYDFLRVLEARGARYSLLRALPVDAQFVLRVLGFCSTQVFVFINMVRSGRRAEELA